MQLCSGSLSSINPTLTLGKVPRKCMNFWILERHCLGGTAESDGCRRLRHCSPLYDVVYGSFSSELSMIADVPET